MSSSTANQLPARSNRPRYSSIESLQTLPIMIGVQFVFIWLLSKTLQMFYVTKLRIELLPGDIDPNRSYILAANHQSMVDPFLISSSLQFNTWRKLAPIRTFAHTIFFTRWYLYPWLVAFGCFPARRHPDLPYGLELANKLLRGNQTIAIFPEGQRTIPGKTYAKHGVAILAKSPGTMVIPVHLQWTSGNIFTRRMTLAIGRPKDLSKSTAQQILTTIYDLQLPTS